MAAHTVGAQLCADCGAAVGGNFCSNCGCDLRGRSSGALGSFLQPARRSFPAVFLRLLRSPVKQTVALAEDPSYRAYGSFLLSGLAIFCVLFIPIVLKTIVPANSGARVSEDMQTLMKVLAQAGLYAGIAMTFGLAYALFRYFATVPRTYQAYFKLFCIALGFVMPLYAAYETVTRGLLGVTGMSSLEGPMTSEQWTMPSTLVALAMSLALWVYFIALHRRFWGMPVWKATVLYAIAAVVANKVSFVLMYIVGYYSAALLVSNGLLKT